jgi:hypothetical protein
MLSSRQRTFEVLQAGAPSGLSASIGVQACKESGNRRATRLKTIYVDSRQLYQRLRSDNLAV